MISRMVRRVTVWLVASLLVPGFALAQPAGTPAGNDQPEGLPPGPEFIRSEGVTSVVLAEVQADALGGDSILLLEQLSLPPSGSLPAHTSVSTEILFVQEGTVTIADSFGFSATTPAGQTLTFAAGSSYELANGGADPVSVLRLTASAGEGVPAGIEASPTALEREALIAQPIDGLDGPVTLFLATAVFEPGASSGHLSHDGPLGIVIEAGTLDVLSPSGLTGQLQEGTAVVLPSTTPLVASNSGTDDAVVLFAGVVAAGGSLVSEASPTPAPTDLPAQEPTVPVTPSPTVPLEPTTPPEPERAGGAIMQMGETFEGDGATLTVAVGDVRQAGVNISFIYTNTSAGRADFVIPEGFLDVHDDLGVTWKPREGVALTGSRVILEPGDTFTGWWDFAPNGERDAARSHTANVFLTFHGLGGISQATWGFTIANGKILAIPADAVDPAESASALATPLASPQATPIRGVAGPPRNGGRSRKSGSTRSGAFVLDDVARFTQDSGRVTRDALGSTLWQAEVLVPFRGVGKRTA